MNSFSLRSTATIALLTILMPLIALGQDAPAADQESVSMTVGDIMEILPSHAFANPTYSWILTQDRTFIQAGRAKTFRYRFIQPGMYTLIAEVASADQSNRVRRTFSVNVASRTPQQSPVEENTGTTEDLVISSPPEDEAGRVVLIEGSRLLKIIPLDPNVRPLALDVNTAVDSDEDGSASNDLDGGQTFFQTDATPLFVWFVSGVESQSMSVTALDAQGEAIVQNIEVLSEEYALSQGLVTSAVTVDIEQRDGRNVAFSASFARPLPPSTPLLYHWEFGDGSQSLLMTPTHAYAEDGTFTVSLRVRNLADGQEVAFYEEEITVESAGVPQEPDGGDTGTTIEPEPPAEGNAFPWNSILLYSGIFLAVLLLGLIAYALITFFRRRGGNNKLSDRLEAIEQTIVKKDDKAATQHLAITPPATATATPPADISKREQERAAATPTPAPKVDADAAPDWLKSGLQAQPKAPQPAKATPPAQAPKPAQPVAPPAVARQPVTPPAPKQTSLAPSRPPAPPAQQQSATTQVNVPAWLQQTPKQTPPPRQQQAAQKPPATTPPPTPTGPAAPTTLAARPASPPQPPAAPTPTPPAPQNPPAPKAATPAPATPPLPPAPQTPAPAAPQPKAPPAPVQQSTPPAAPLPPAAPTPPPAQAAPPAPTDQPIAIIRADSLNTQNGTAPQPPKNPSEPQDIQPA